MVLPPALMFPDCENVPRTRKLQHCTRTTFVHARGDKSNVSRAAGRHFRERKREDIDVPKHNGIQVYAQQQEENRQA